MPSSAAARSAGDGIRRASCSRCRGTDKVMTEMPPVMGAEDFAFMLEARPGTMIAIGNGDTAGLHDPAYDFNDEAIPYGVSYWTRLVETAMPA
jgi:metal-dependent amidase/aminoacylase/carboxypeptidase family protein